MGYVVEAHVARGGMGDVYRARVEATGELVALKVMRHTGDDPAGEEASAARERFAREARIVAQLIHPAIVRYVAHGSTVDGRPYIASEWLDGETLDARFVTRRMSAKEAASVGATLASALAAAHAAGIVHRDVKPSNVIVTADGAVKLFDFGVAKVRERGLTRDGALVGTHGYMAPEQLRGSSDVGPAADVFGLGCVLFRGLVGALPWGEGDGDADGLAARLLAGAGGEGSATDVRVERNDVGDDFARLIACMLHGDATARPAAAELASWLGAIAAEAADEPPPALRSEAVSPAEKALVTVVVIGAAAPGDVTQVDAAKADAHAPGHGHAHGDDHGALRSFFEGRGARAEVVAHGACVAVFADGGGIGEQARVAARAALDVRSLAPGRPVAVATGRAIVTGRSATGDAVARAFALVRSGETHGVIVDGASASLVESRFVVGESAAPDARLLTAERTDTEVGRTVCGRAVPLFGRDVELGVLSDACIDAFRTARTASAIVVGPAGAGKSRLASEVAARVRAELPGAAVVSTRSDPLGAGAPFAAAAAIVRAVVARGPAPVPAALAPFVAQLVDPRARSDDEALRAARLDPTLMRDRLRDAFRAVIEGACTLHPLVLVLDDVQWVDAASLRLVDDVVERGQGPLFVMMLARPEVREGAPPRASLALDLLPLEPTHAAELATFVVGASVRRDVIERIVRLGDGNAFFLEELARAAATGDRTPLPDSVIALTQSRLGALPPFSRRVLRAASIVRPRVTEDAITHLLGDGASREVVKTALDELVAREVLVRRTTPEHGFDFRHELLAEAAYATLTDDDARRGHLAAASFADSGVDGDPRRAAEHLERGGDRARAAVVHARAAEVTLRSGDVAGAIACADRADACGAEGEAKGRVLAVRSAVEKWHGDVARAVTLGTSALDMLDPADPLFSEAAADVATAAGAAGDEAALAHIAARLLGGPAAPEAWRIRALSAAALSLVRVGSVADADRVLARAESMRAALVRDQAIADLGLDNARAARRTYAGDPTAYVMIMPVVIDSATRLGDARSACLARAHLGYGHAAVGSWAAAESTLLGALEEANRLALPAGRASVLHNLARVREAQGAVAEGAALQEQALVAALEQRNARLASACRLYLARNSHAGARPQVGLAQARLARANAKERPLRAWADAILAELLLDVGDFESALEHAREAFAFFELSGGIGEGDAAVHLAHAKALLATGAGTAAGQALLAARDRLLARARMIGDVALARQFLEGVEENAATIALCRREGIPVDL